MGTIGAIVIILSNNFIANYFNNPQLHNLIIYVAFRPLFSNIIGLYQTLYISNQMTKAIAVRNLVISISQVAITTLVALFVQNIALIFILLCVLDLAQILVFSAYYNRKIFKINILKLDYRIIKQIFIYAIPLGIAILMGSILKDMDKLVIGKLMSTENLALYTNMSKPLPFSFIGASFTTVVTPVIIKLLNAGKKQKLTNIWSNYLQLGYLTTWMFCCGAIVCAPELLKFLYSDKYIDGLNVFIVFIIVEMFRFTYFGMILTALGKTRVILLYSLVTMIVNLALNVILYHFMGMIGTAVATLLSIAVIGIIQLIHSTSIIHISFFKVINAKRMLFYIIQLFINSVVCLLVKNVVYMFTSSKLIVIIVIYGLFVLLTLSINIKYIKKIIDNMKFVDK